MGDSKHDNLSVVREEHMMVSQDKENMDDEENSTVIFDSVHLSHTQEFCNDLMEQESYSNGDTNEALYPKALNTVLYVIDNSEGSAMMTEQSIWSESSSSPTLQEDMLNDKTYKNSSNNCGIMEHKSKLVEQVSLGLDDGLSRLMH